MKNRSKLPFYLTASVLALALSTPAVAQDAASTDKEEAKKEKTEKTVEVEEVVVTGSLIPRPSTNTDSMSPVTVVSSEEMTKRGYISLGDVMKNATQNSGYSEGKASNLLGRFTTGGQEVNLRGFGAGRTLVLVNGRRIADYPLPFGGEQNGADIGTIPAAAVAKTELLSAGASAIYGSDAVGGVVNYITKRDMEQTTAQVTTGMNQQGYGEYVQASLVTGKAFDRGSFTFGIDGMFSKEILASDVGYIKDNAPYIASLVQLQKSDSSGISNISAASACDDLGMDENGDLCTKDLNDTISLSPKIKQVSAFFDGRFQLTDDIEIFATAMGSGNKYLSRSNILYWNGTVVRDDYSEAIFVARGFTEAELGTADVTDKQYMWTGVVGAKGGIDVGGDRWYWDVSYSHGNFKTSNSFTSLKEEGVRNWLLNGAESADDFDGQSYTYVVDGDFFDNGLVSNVLSPIQPGDIDSMVGQNVTEAKSASSALTLTLNGTLGDLGIFARPVKFAIRSEIARQSTEITPNARALDETGNGWYQIGAILSKGVRHRKALSTEFEIPVFDRLDVSLAGRYDHYSDASAVSGRASAQAKFIYRATDWLKVRGGYSQTFRAPDMFNIYGRSDGFETVPDFSAPGCYDGTSYYCGYTTVGSSRQADTNLKEETGHDFGLGAIVMPAPNFNFTVDWYKVRLNDLVLTETGYDLLYKEWQCNEGQLEGSEQLCADVKSRVFRNDFDQLEKIVVRPINQDSLQRQGLDVQAYYFFESEKYGRFEANLSYSKVLDFKLLRFAGDEAIDLTHGEPGLSTPSDTMSLGINWFNPLTTGKSVGAGINVLRRGGVRDFSGTQSMKPMYDANMSVGYQFSHRGSISLIVQNVLNTKPQDNRSGFWPGFWQHLQWQNAMGRAFYLQLGYQFN